MFNCRQVSSRPLRSVKKEKRTSQVFFSPDMFSGSEFRRVPNYLIFYITFFGFALIIENYKLRSNGFYLVKTKNYFVIPLPLKKNIF